MEMKTGNIFLDNANYPRGTLASGVIKWGKTTIYSSYYILDHKIKYSGCRYSGRKYGLVPATDRFSDNLYPAARPWPQKI